MAQRDQAAPPEVQREDHRFVVTDDGSTAELTFRLVGRRLVLIHTGVPDAMSGKGIGGLLVRAAVDWASASGFTVVPKCPFAGKWLQEHPDVATTVTVDWNAV
jgi:hypothetical protein